MQVDKMSEFEKTSFADFVQPVPMELGNKLWSYTVELFRANTVNPLLVEAFKHDHLMAKMAESVPENLYGDLFARLNGEVVFYTLMGIAKEIYSRHHSEDQWSKDLSSLKCIAFNQDAFDKAELNLKDFEDLYFQSICWLMRSKHFEKVWKYALPERIVWLMLEYLAPDSESPVRIINSELSEFLPQLRGYDVIMDSEDPLINDFSYLMDDAVNAYFSRDRKIKDVEDSLVHSSNQVLYISKGLDSAIEDAKIDELYEELPENGRMAMLVRTSWLSKPFENKEYQKVGIGRMYADDTIQSITQLPKDLMANTSASVSIIVVSKSRKNEEPPFPHLSKKDYSSVSMRDFSDRGHYFNYDISAEEFFDDLHSWRSTWTYDDLDNGNIDPWEDVSSEKTVYFKSLAQHRGILIPALYRYSYYEHPYCGVKIKDPILRDEVAEDKDIHVVRQNDLSPVFPVCQVQFDPLDDFYREDQAVVYQGPATLFHREKGKISTGYVSEDILFSCEDGIVVLDARNKEVAQAHAGLMFERETQSQIEAIDAEDNCFGTYPEHFSALRFDDYQNYSDYIKLRLSEANAELAERLNEAYAKYQKEIHTRKHAMSQVVSAISIYLDKLIRYSKNCQGGINLSDVVSPKLGTTVQGLLDSLAGKVALLERQTTNLAEVEYNWGEKEKIDPQEYLSNYVKDNPSDCFVYDFNEQKPNHYVNAHGIEGKEALFSCAKDALARVMNNIISNAVSHGFANSQRNDYKVRLRWTIADSQVVISVANNGAPMHEDLDEDSAMRYGISTAMNNDEGHLGIGCYDIKNIVESQGGTVGISKLQNQEYTVEYVLRFNNER